MSTPCPPYVNCSNCAFHAERAASNQSTVTNPLITHTASPPVATNENEPTTGPDVVVMPVPTLPGQTGSFVNSIRQILKPVYFTIIDDNELGRETFIEVHKGIQLDKFKATIASAMGLDTTSEQIDEIQYMFVPGKEQACFIADDDDKDEWITVVIKNQQNLDALIGMIQQLARPPSASPVMLNVSTKPVVVVTAPVAKPVEDDEDECLECTCPACFHEQQLMKMKKKEEERQKKNVCSKDQKTDVTIDNPFTYLAKRYSEFTRNDANGGDGNTKDGLPTLPFVCYATFYCFCAFLAINLLPWSCAMVVFATLVTALLIIHTSKRTQKLERLAKTANQQKTAATR